MKMRKAMGIFDYSGSMKKVDNKSINKSILLNEIMDQLNITDDDLKNDPSWIKAIIRDNKISKILDK